MTEKQKIVLNKTFFDKIFVSILIPFIINTTFSISLIEIQTRVLTFFTALFKLFLRGDIVHILTISVSRGKLFN